MKYLKFDNQEIPNVALEDNQGASKGETIFTAVIFGVLGLIMAWGKWNEYRRKNREDSNVEKSLEKQTGVLLSAISKTYANKSWLDKQTFNTGTVAGGDISKVLSVNNKMPTDVVAVVNKTIRDIENTADQLARRYREWQLNVNATARPLYKKAEELGETRSTDKSLYDLWMKVDSELRKIKHPLAGESWKNLPDGRSIPGGFSFQINDKYSGDIVDEDSNVVKKNNAVTIDQLPSLNKDDVFAFGVVMILLLKKLKDRSGFFAEAFGQLYHAPCPQDSDPAQTWKSNDGLDDFFERAYIDHSKNNDPEFYQTEIWKIGSLTDQAWDPLFILDDVYHTLCIDIIKVMNLWIKRSIKH